MKFLELLSLILVICCGVAYNDNSNESLPEDVRRSPEKSDDFTVPPQSSSANPISSDAVSATPLESATTTNKCLFQGIQFQFFERVRIL